MPKGTPEGAKRPTGSGGSSGARGSSGSSSAGSAARRTAKTIKDINKPMSKASKQLAADATAARNARMANITPKDYKAAPRTTATGSYYDSSGKLRSTPSSLYGQGRDATRPSRTPDGSAGRETKMIRTSNPSGKNKYSLSEPSPKAAKKAAKSTAKNLASINKPNSRRMKKATASVAAEKSIQTRLNNMKGLSW